MDLPIFGWLFDEYKREIADADAPLSDNSAVDQDRRALLPHPIAKLDMQRPVADVQRKFVAPANRGAFSLSFGNADNAIGRRTIMPPALGFDRPGPFLFDVIIERETLFQGEDAVFKAGLDIGSELAAWSSEPILKNTIGISRTVKEVFEAKYCGHSVLCRTWLSRTWRPQILLPKSMR